MVRLPRLLGSSECFYVFGVVVLSDIEYKDQSLGQRAISWDGQCRRQDGEIVSLVIAALVTVPFL
jgi:hypothetical protein